MMLGTARFLLIVAALCFASSARAETQASMPTKFNIPWGNAAGPSYIRAIPQNSQIGITNCAASLTDGFPPLTFTPAASGGCPPFGQDFNGILNQITKWVQWQIAGAPVFYDSSFATGIGGYPKGTRLMSSVLQGRIWYSTADNNSTNPDDQTGAAANWVAAPGTNLPGQPVASLTTTIPLNTVSANGLTVGNASSNATGRANADTYWLFLFLWTNCANCTLYNSSGGVIGRGATAQADWNANDAIATVNMNGAGLIGADSQNGTSSSNLSGVGVVSGNTTTPTSIVGSNLVTLTASQIPTITSNGTISGTTTSNAIINGSGAGIGGGGSFGILGSLAVSGTASVTSNNTGGAAHPVVQRSIITYWNLAL